MVFSGLGFGRFGLVWCYCLFLVFLWLLFFGCWWFWDCGWGVWWCCWWICFGRLCVLLLVCVWIIGLVWFGVCWYWRDCLVRLRIVIVVDRFGCDGCCRLFVVGWWNYCGFCWWNWLFLALVCWKWFVVGYGYWGRLFLLLDIGGVGVWVGLGCWFGGYY